MRLCAWVVTDCLFMIAGDTELPGKQRKRPSVMNVTFCDELQKGQHRVEQCGVETCFIICVIKLYIVHTGECFIKIRLQLVWDKNGLLSVLGILITYALVDSDKHISQYRFHIDIDYYWNIEMVTTSYRNVSNIIAVGDNPLLTFMPSSHIIIPKFYWQLDLHQGDITMITLTLVINVPCNTCAVS